MPAVNICESRKAIQWTGSNAAEIDASITDLTIDSNAGGILTINSTTVLSASVVRVNVQTSLASLGGAHIMVIVKA